MQDVMSAVGAPSRIFYKSEDKMKIHSPNAHRKASLLKSDYFYNYFTFGMVRCSNMDCLACTKGFISGLAVRCKA